MRERAFIEQNKDKWQEFEQKLNSNISSDELIKGYHDIKNDLAYAQTFYPESKLPNYINRIVARAHLKIYAVKKTTTQRIIQLWTDDVPAIMYRYRKITYFTFILFIAFVCIGLETNFRQLLPYFRTGKPLILYLCGQSLNIVLTLIMAYLMFGVLFPPQ